MAQGAFLNEAPIHVSGQSTLEGARIIASGGLFKKRIWEEPWPEVKSRWVNSVAYRMALVAAASADATLSLSAKSEWDVAAAALLVEEAGGDGHRSSGRRARFQSSGAALLRGWSRAPPACTQSWSSEQAA